MSQKFWDLILSHFLDRPLDSPDIISLYNSYNTLLHYSLSYPCNHSFNNLFLINFFSSPLIKPSQHCTVVSNLLLFIWRLLIRRWMIDIVVIIIAIVFKFWFKRDLFLLEMVQNLQGWRVLELPDMIQKVTGSKEWKKVICWLCEDWIWIILALIKGMLDWVELLFSRTLNFL